MNNLTRVLLLLVLLGTLCAGALIYKSRAKYSLSELHNSQVRWTGGYQGILPVLSGKAEAVSQANDPEFIPNLIRCLANDEQYAAAHVILTGIAGGSYHVSGGSWNELDVQLTDDQQIIPATCPPELKQKWQAWQRGQSKLGF